jgi:hypothetical protein
MEKTEMTEMTEKAQETYCPFRFFRLFRNPLRPCLNSCDFYFNDRREDNTARRILLRVHLPNQVKTMQDEIRNERIKKIFLFKQSAEPSSTDHCHRLARKTFGLHSSRNLTDCACGAEKKS